MVVEGEAELEQEAALQNTGRHARVADRAEEDGVVGLEGVEVGVGEGLTGGVVPPGTEVELLGLQLHILRKDGGEDLQTFGHDLLADAVTGNHCEIEAARHDGTLPLVPRDDMRRPACGRPRRPQEAARRTDGTRTASAWRRAAQ